MGKKASTEHNQLFLMELAKGVEPPTGGLQIRCSTN